jgi:hypothetical protein
MLQDTIRMIEERIEGSSSLSGENRAALKELLATLQREVEQLASTHGEQARSITAFTDTSFYEATRKSPNPKLMELSRQGLSASVEEFESSHPKLVTLVNRICTILSNLGV